VASDWNVKSGSNAIDVDAFMIAVRALETLKMAFFLAIS
jgi:hypothetical protein